MTKLEFIDLFGEDPEDMFGGDWRNIVDDYYQDDVVSLRKVVSWRKAVNENV